VITLKKGGNTVKLSDAQTRKLLEYNGSLQLKQLALSMALTRLKKRYREDPTPVVLSKCTSELNGIFEKFASIMQTDYDCIVSL
jgi:hypothetical protein